MIRVDYATPNDAGWLKWRKRADAESQTLRNYAEKMAAVDYDGFEPPDVKESLYKAAREWLVIAFHGKCAFCESPITASQSGDVEHFRPKKAVHNDDRTDAQFRTKKGELKKHPGYFWLMYDWSNLLLACSKCNSQGKANFFPVESPDTRAISPSGVAQEHPLFINPLLEDPSKHLRFEETGMAIGFTPSGEKCVEMLDLNRDALLAARRKTYVNARMSFEAYMGLKTSDPEFAERQSEIRDYYEGRREYAAQARVAIDKAKNQIQLKLQSLGI